MSSIIVKLDCGCYISTHTDVLVDKGWSIKKILSRQAKCNNCLKLENLKIDAVSKELLCDNCRNEILNLLNNIK